MLLLGKEGEFLWLKKWEAGRGRAGEEKAGVFCMDWSPQEEHELYFGGNGKPLRTYLEE